MNLCKERADGGFGAMLLEVGKELSAGIGEKHLTDKTHGTCGAFDIQQHMLDF
jgi:hypothetical protein